MITNAGIPILGGIFGTIQEMETPWKKGNVPQLPEGLAYLWGSLKTIPRSESSFSALGPASIMRDPRTSEGQLWADQAGMITFETSVSVVQT